MAVDYDDLGLEVQYRDGIVRGEDRELRLPWRVRTSVQVGEQVILVLQPGTEGAPDPDFELTNGLENLVAVGPDCTRQWTVEAVGTTDPADGDYHKSPVVSTDRLVTRRYSGRFHEFDPETGVEIDSWPNTTFVLGGRRIEFGDSVGQVKRYGDTWVLNTGNSLYGFDEHGVEKWVKSIDYSWVLETRYGRCAAWTEPVMGKKMVVELDLETGRFSKAFRCPPTDAKRILDLAEPSLVITGASTHVILMDTDGDRIWQDKVEERVGQAIELDEYYVIRTNDDVVYTLDAAGEQVWEREMDDCYLVENADGLVIRRKDGEQLRLDVETGDVIERVVQ